MSLEDVPWDLVALLRAVLRDGSLSAAARRLGIAQPTARRQLERLEGALGTVLFTRSPSGLTPTEAARGLAPYAEAMASSMEALVRAASAPAAEDAGTVRITCSEMVGAEVLPPIVSDLVRAHPKLAVELVPTDRIEDLLRRDADVAVRMTAPTQASLVAQRAGTIAVGLFATKGYLASHGHPRALADLRRGHVLVGDDRARGIRAGLAAKGLVLERGDFAFRSDSTVAQLAAVRAGVGIGACQLGIAARTPSLERVLPRVRFELPTWVVTHEDLRSVRRIRVVVDALARGIARYARA